MQKIKKWSISPVFERRILFTKLNLHCFESTSWEKEKKWKNVTNVNLPIYVTYEWAYAPSYNLIASPNDDYRNSDYKM